MIKLLYADCDLTLISFPAEPAYTAAEVVLRAQYPDIPPGAALAQYHAIHAHDRSVREAIAYAFGTYVERDYRPLGGFMYSPPEESVWSRYAAFRVLLEEHIGKALTRDQYDSYTTVCFEAESRFWQVVGQYSRRYEDTDRLIVDLRRNHALLQPITSSDVRCTLRGCLAHYSPGVSTELKQKRLKPLLAWDNNIGTPYVFEEHRKSNAEGWSRFPWRFVQGDMFSESAILGDSLGDVEAGVTMEMPIRILIDRNGKYDSRPEPATHLVRSLDEVPAILGWL